MRLVTYWSAGRLRSGIRVDHRIVDTVVAARAAGFTWAEDGQPWVSTRNLLGLGGETLARVHAAAMRTEEGFDAASLRFGPPVPDPEKILCLGLNYREHVNESGWDAPTAPMIFGKFANSLVGSHEAVVLPAASTEVDYEAELAVVIGRDCANVTPEQAKDYIAGYMAFNDLSARDRQRDTSQIMAGKAIDGFAPCGPDLVVGEIDDPQQLDITCRLNGEVVQSSNTSLMLISVAETISYLSGLSTLVPGDIIATGTPSGVGVARVPPVYLRAGDVVEVEIDRIGVLVTPLHAPVQEPESV